MIGVKDGGPAFPRTPARIAFDDSAAEYHEGYEGMSILDYFAVRAPAPTDQRIEMEHSQDRLRNPHGDAYKPRVRTVLEIEWDLRYAWAAAGVTRREVKEGVS